MKTQCPFKIGDQIVYKSSQRGYALRCFTFVIVMASVTLMSACDDDRGRTVEVDATTTATSRRPDVRVTASSTVRNSGDHETRQEVINENILRDGSTSMYYDNFELIDEDQLFLQQASITVDAGSYLDSDGNYVVGDQVFTNCDDLGFYFISLDPAATIWITNCGTTAFP